MKKTIRYVLCLDKRCLGRAWKMNKISKNGINHKKIQ